MKLTENHLTDSTKQTADRGNNDFADITRFIFENKQNIFQSLWNFPFNG